MEAKHVNEFHRHLGLLLQKQGMGEKEEGWKSREVELKGPSPDPVAFSYGS